MYCDCDSVGRAGWLVIAKVAGSNPGSPGMNWAACRCVIEQDTEPQIAPDVQLPSVRALRWAGDLARVSCLRPETAGIGYSNNARDSLKNRLKIKWLQLTTCTIIFRGIYIYTQKKSRGLLCSVFSDTVKYQVTVTVAAWGKNNCLYVWLFWCTAHCTTYLSGGAWALSLQVVRGHWCNLPVSWPWTGTDPFGGQASLMTNKQCEGVNQTT